jgi:hypothetical protein
MELLQTGLFIEGDLTKLEKELGELPHYMKILTNVLFY